MFNQDIGNTLDQEDSGVAPENCMLAGDTIFDILCAGRAGAYAAAVKSGFDGERILSLHKADLLLDSVKDLPAVLKPYMPKE